MKPQRSFLAVAAVAALAVAACGSDSASDAGADATSDTAQGATEAAAAALTFTDAWSRQPGDGQTVGVVYGLATNSTDADIRILSASSPTSDDVELHQTTVADDGVMSMSEVEDGFVVAAGGEFLFEPGGPHIMLLDIDAATFPTNEVDVTLTLDSGEDLSFVAPVEAIGGGDDDAMDMEEMDHSEMDHSGDDTEEMDMEEMDHSDEDHSDHGDETEFSDPDAPEVSQLHELDESLEAGELDAATQRPIVQEFIGYLTAQDPADDSEQADLLTTLEELDQALEAGDLDAAAIAADTAHANAHTLEGTT